MRFRIVAGELGGRFISMKEGAVPFRPTQERVRQSVAEILKNKIPGAVAADICAGSGAFGFEMISRGAKSVDFVEKDRFRAKQIAENAVELGCSMQCVVVSRDVSTFVNAARQQYSVVYYDPPYDMLQTEQIYSVLGTLLTDDGVLVYEHRRDVPLRNISFTGLMLSDTREYGGTVVDFYQR